MTTLLATRGAGFGLGRHTTLSTRRGKHERRSPALLIVGFFLTMTALGHTVHANDENGTKVKRIPTQYIAALGEPDATSGTGAESWGLWREDPGPRGVWLGNYEQLKAAGGVAEAQWKFDGTDWWMEENGLIMEKPDFPLRPGKYVVTGNREVTSVLTIHPMGENGTQLWELANSATLYDVTHLKCRSARYTPANNDNSCSPTRAQKASFPVSPGAAMPPVENCSKQDYQVLIVIGMIVET